MIPNEKAKELIEKFQIIYAPAAMAKQCALICCDEVIKALDKSSLMQANENVFFSEFTNKRETAEVYISQWQSVKKSITEIP